MDNRNLICFDLETSNINPAIAEIVSIGAVAINRNNLSFMDEFYSLVKPLNEDNIDNEALKVCRLTREQLSEAPEPKLIFPIFADWIKKFNTRKDKSAWGAPIPCGWNITGFDLPIFARYCKEFKYWDDKRNNQTLLNPIFSFDVMQHMWFWTRTNPDVDKLKLSEILSTMGMSVDTIENEAHNSLWDAKVTAKIAVKLLQIGEKKLNFSGWLKE